MLGMFARRGAGAAPPQAQEAHSLSGSLPPLLGGAGSDISFDSSGVIRKLRRLERPCHVLQAPTRNGVSHQAAEAGHSLLATIPPVLPSQLGAQSFLRDYGVKYAYMTGAMAKGIASEDLVIALGKAGFLGCFGAGALPLARLEQAIVRIQQALPHHPYAFNLLHSPRKLQTEAATVDLYLKYGVRNVEASSYMSLTSSIVRYRLAGLEAGKDGGVLIKNRIIVKLSRVELGSQFMHPAPAEMVQQLLDRGVISQEQAALAARVPMADDVTVEADSGGHTDNRPLVNLLPAMIRLRDAIQRRMAYANEIRVGAAGGISTPESVLAAFTMGADYVVTGSINQACVEAGTSDAVKRLLAQVSMTDVAMAPESDMFEQGFKVQAIKRGSLFPMRAQKLFDLYQKYNSIDDIPPAEKQTLEKHLFKDSLENIWTQTAAYFSVRNPAELIRAENPKVKMVLVFRWYLGQSSIWAIEGRADRLQDYQIWCGPAMGAFNNWARGMYLESAENRRVADVARLLMSEAAYLYRAQLLKMLGFSELLAAEAVAEHAA